MSQESFKGQKIKIFFSLFLALQTTLASANSYFDDVWRVTQSDPYQELPQVEVNFRSFYGHFRDKLQEASERTLSNKDDIIPYFRKLLHPNGMCFAGTWSITEDNPYTGYFRPGSTGKIILRASTALSSTKLGEKRAFGLAGKIFPTETFDEFSATSPKSGTGKGPTVKTANFFVIENLGGSYTPSLLDAPMTNDITAIDFGPEAIPQTPILAAAVKAFAFAEKTFGSILSVRQLYPISELGEPEGANIITPKWLKIQGQPGMRSGAMDFRDDLRLANNGGQLTFDIFVSSQGLIGLPKKWKKVGEIQVEEEALAEGCDHRLHFSHPKWRNDLQHSSDF